MAGGAVRPAVPALSLAKVQKRSPSWNERALSVASSSTVSPRVLPGSPSVSVLSSGTPRGTSVPSPRSSPEKPIPAAVSVTSRFSPKSSRTAPHPAVSRQHVKYSPRAALRPAHKTVSSGTMLIRRSRTPPKVITVADVSEQNNGASGVNSHPESSGVTLELSTPPEDRLPSPCRASPKAAVVRAASSELAGKPYRTIVNGSGPGAPVPLKKKIMLSDATQTDSYSQDVGVQAGDVDGTHALEEALAHGQAQADGMASLEAELRNHEDAAEMQAAELHALARACDAAKADLSAHRRMVSERDVVIKDLLGRIRHADSEKARLQDALQAAEASASTQAAAAGRQASENVELERAVDELRIAVAEYKQESMEQREEVLRLSFRLEKEASSATQATPRVADDSAATLDTKLTDTESALAAAAQRVAALEATLTTLQGVHDVTTQKLRALEAERAGTDVRTAGESASLSMAPRQLQTFETAAQHSTVQRRGAVAASDGVPRLLVEGFFADAARALQAEEVRGRQVIISFEEDLRIAAARIENETSIRRSVALQAQQGTLNAPAPTVTSCWQQCLPSWCNFSPSGV